MMKITSDSEESSMGFKDKEKALHTLKVLDGRDISYQYNVITGFIRRCRRVLDITKDEEKLAKIQDALNVFNEWLEDYKKEGKSKQNFAYLPLKIVESYKILAKSYGVLEEDFLKAYEEEKGEHKNLRNVKTPNGDVTWDIERNKRLRELTLKIKSKYIPWYKVDQSIYRGLPTEEHTRCILLGYSPEPTKLKKLIPQVIEKCRNADQPTDEMTNESGSAEKGKKRSHSTSSEDERENENGPKHHSKIQK